MSNDRNSTTKAMTLEQAISLLCGVHLGAVEFNDWEVRMGAMPETPWDREGYVEAWSVLRDHLLKSRAP